MKSDIELLDYTYTDVTVKVLSEFKNKAPIEKPWSYTFNWNFLLNESKNDKDRFKIVLWVDFKQAPKDKDKFPYEIHMEMMALVNYKPRKERLAEKEIPINVTLWCLSILYGMMRSTIGEISSQSYHGKFILPPVNFIEGVRQKLTHKK
jgi:preprotein translocase subunit SecB